MHKYQDNYFQLSPEGQSTMHHIDSSIAHDAARKINAMVHGLTHIGCNITHQEASDIHFELFLKK